METRRICLSIYLSDNYDKLKGSESFHIADCDSGQSRRLSYDLERNFASQNPSTSCSRQLLENLLTTTNSF